jgi:hypothetical protein
VSGWPLLSVVYESRGYVWDAGTLEWVPATQAGGGGGDATAANQVTEIARLTSILAQLDVALSTRASQTTLAAIAAQLPAALTAAGNLKVALQEVAALTASAPTAVSVGVASAQVLASNASRKGAVFMNTSDATISLGQSGNAAVLNSGITLDPGASFTMPPELVTTGQINGIASSATSNLAVQEYT